jgi:hypothetical protein
VTGLISVESSSSSLFVPYALDLATRFCGVRFELLDPFEPRERVDVYYGNDIRRPCGLRIPHVDRYTIDDVPGIPSSVEYQRLDPAFREAFPFDIFTATRFWLADEGNANRSRESFDQHERLRWNCSAQEIRGLREVPVVNSYLMLLREWLAARLGVRTSPMLSAPARCVVVLSHDVDRPIDPGRPQPIVRRAVETIVRGKRRAPAFAEGSVALAGALAARLQSPPPRHWIFGELADAEAQCGFRSTFFLAPTSRFDDHGHRLDVAYDVMAPEFRDVCRMLQERQFEIGLHIGYGVQSDSERLLREKQRLEEAAEMDVIGARHHYWHTGYPFWGALDAHATVGLRYDSSIAFNEAVGFRLGIAFPYRPWHPIHKRPVETLQIPPMAMDGAFFYKPGQSVDHTLGHFARLVDQLKKYEGVASLDWHQETSLPASREFWKWGQADLLAADPEVSVRSFADVLATTDARNSNHPSD